MTKSIKTDVLIIGSGPAGYTAAIYAARANLNPHLVSGLEPGGQLTITTDVENYPGFGDIIQGPWLMEQMKEQALKVGTEFHHDIVKKVDFDINPFIAETDSGLKFNSKSIIIATGAQARWLNLDSENKFKGFGIVDCKSTWKPSFLIRTIAGRKAKKFDTTILFDYNAELRNLWGLKKDSYNIIILDQNRICREIVRGKVTVKKQEELIQLIIDLQKKM